MTTATEYLGRYENALLGVFGEPAIVVEHGDGAYVVDVDGHRYLDLLGGIAVNSLGYGHPALIDAVTKQAQAAVHVSNFFTTPAQVELGEELLQIAAAPHGSRVFFCNSGTEANEAAIKLARRTGRSRIIAAIGGFHGRTMGALSLTAKQAYRDPFEPLVPGVTHVPFDDVDALEAELDDQVGAVFLEPIQGEAGVILPSAGYLEAVRKITAERGILLILDEVQTGVGRTGDWFAHASAQIVPDAITVAKGLGGGVPIGALITFGSSVSGLLTVGQHGTTFGGNPLASAAALAVLRTIRDEGLLEHVREMGEHIARRVADLGDDRIRGQRGQGLLRAIILRDEVASSVMGSARNHGFIVNAVGSSLIRLAPPLVISRAEIDTFFDALPGILDESEKTP